MDSLTIALILALLVMVILSFFAGKALGKRYMFEIMQQVMEKEKKEAEGKQDEESRCEEKTP